MYAIYSTILPYLQFYLLFMKKCPKDQYMQNNFWAQNMLSLHFASSILNL